MDKVSIIVPVYNAYTTLDRCLSSIINQTYNELEIICINDGSSDDSLEKIKEYQHNDDRVVIYDNEVNKGVAFTKNLGLMKATGKFVCFVDSDDYIATDMVEKLMAFQRKEKLDIVKFHYNYYVDGKLHNTSLCYDRKTVLETKEKLNGFRYKLLSGEIPGYMPLLLIKKDIIKDTRIDSDISFLEDLIFYLKLFAKNIRVGILNERLYNYVNNKNGLTFSLDNNKIKKRIEGIRYYYSYVRDNINDDEANRIVTNRCSYMLVHSLFELYRVDRANKKLIDDYLQDDEINDILDNCELKEMDRFTRYSLKRRKKRGLYVFFEVVKKYIDMKEKR